VVESGALARQAASGQPLLRDALARLGSNVFTRVLARLFDLVETVTLMEQALAALQPREAFCSAPGPLALQGEGMALVETARGALGHWLRIEKGRVADWLVIAPTRWHFSPRDASGQPGAVETALEGAPLLAGESMAPIAAQHVVRSFDPGRACVLR
jgi:hydrogenase large subunit